MMKKKKERLEKHLENERQLNAKLDKYSPEGSRLDKQKDVNLYRIDFEDGLVHVRINPRASRELIHFLLDKELDEKYPPLHKKKKELTVEQRDIFESGMRDIFQKAAASGIAPQELKSIQDDFWDAWIGRRIRAERLRDLEVYRLKTVLKRTYKNIASVTGMATPDAARKAYGRAYELIHRKGIKTIALLAKSCGTCKNMTCLKYGKPCPEIEAQANVDWKEAGWREESTFGLIASEERADQRGPSVHAKGKRPPGHGPASTG